jgi:MFS transporter, LPLT family, lysophospholipid transporter
VKRGFYTILAAQFFSALADNALLFAAIALIKMGHPHCASSAAGECWQTPILQALFAFAYVALAPFVGPFADSLPKGRVMFISNGVKIIGCLAMLIGLPPLYAYAIVGIGAAMYSPAKYGILTEFLPAERLVWANGWMEGLTVAAIILGAILGGFMIGPQFAHMAYHYINMPFAESTLDTSPEAAIVVIFCLYVIAAAINTRIPRVAVDHKLAKRTPLFVLQDFRSSLVRLWSDRLGQVSLAVTSLFWGAGATLRLIVLSWSVVALHISQSKATQLIAVVAVGIAIGSALAAKFVQLNQSVRVLPIGIAMGLTTIIMIFVGNLWLAIFLLALIGTMAGYFVVPMNALLQHRGHLLMGAGHSIAVQNFNENICIFVMQAAYAMMIRAEFHINTVIVCFGSLVAATMFLLFRRHRLDQVE